ncbi:MAG: peptidase C39 family protein [Nitrospirae bacterium]|nr:peptidase C39 family protein [Nitrospirota bacterium]
MMRSKKLNRVGAFKCPPLLFLIFLFSCASYALSGYGSFRTIEDVPFSPQLEYQCGPASLAGVLNFWKVNVSPSDIAKEIYSAGAKGTLNIDMVFYAEKKGLKTAQEIHSLEGIKDAIDSGYPLLVMVDYGFWVYEQNHFMVVVGYKDDGIIVNSGEERHKSIPLRDFFKSWKRTGFWSLLIKP